MTRKSFATYFGLAVLTLSLFATTAFASSATSINVKDTDAPGRKPFQTSTISIYAPTGIATVVTVTTVPDNQRLVVEQVSGFCNNLWETRGYVALRTDNSFEFLDKEFWADGRPASAAMHYYLNPGETLQFMVANQHGTDDSACAMTVSGYFVNLP